MKSNQKDSSGSSISGWLCLFLPIKDAFASIGQAAYILTVLIAMVPLFLLTAKNCDETMGEWHVRIFGKTLREKFLHNVQG